MQKYNAVSELINIKCQALFTFCKLELDLSHILISDDIPSEENSKMYVYEMCFLFSQQTDYFIII